MMVNACKINRKRSLFLAEKIYPSRNLNYHRYTTTKLNAKPNKRRARVKCRENK